MTSEIIHVEAARVKVQENNKRIRTIMNDVVRENISDTKDLFSLFPSVIKLLLTGKE